MIVIAVQSAGILALDALGVIELQSKAFPWLATIIGAFIFGFAIVPAGGCATGTYYRSGKGLVGSWLALARGCTIGHAPGADRPVQFQGWAAFVQNQFTTTPKNRDIMQGHWKPTGKSARTARRTA